STSPDCSRHDEMARCFRAIFVSLRSMRDASSGAGRGAPVPTVARLCHPRAMDRTGDLEDLTLTERRWRELAPPEVGASARVLYERVARWSSGNLPGVDVPYDPRQEHHWYYAALIEDF